MNIIQNLILDILHMLKFIVLSELFFSFSKKFNKKI